MTRPASVPVASLLMDENLYPRHKIDQTVVASIRQAMRAGNRLPPVVADRKTRTLTDGTHRVMATVRESGEDATILVEWRDYADRAAMVEDAIRMNTAHGSNLTPWDRMRSVFIARDVGLDQERLASALRMTPEEVEKLAIERTARSPAGDMVPLKQGLGHLRGRKLTQKQADGISGYGGLSASFYVGRVIHMIQHDLVDWTDERITVKLLALRDLLNEDKRLQ